MKNKSLIELEFESPIVQPCNSCQIAKSTSLPFTNSVTRCVAPFDKVHSDLWGPTPTMSIGHFKYYVVFVDDCTGFTRFYPLNAKSDLYRDNFLLSLSVSNLMA